MKLFIKEKCNVSETEVEIRCNTRDSEVDNIIYGIKNSCDFLIAEKENGDISQISIPRILYFEAMERHVFAYLEKDVLKVKRTLYEIEEAYSQMYFVRISKSLIVNIRAIDCIRPEEGRRVKLLLKNGEWLIVSKNYVSALKQAIGMKGV